MDLIQSGPMSPTGWSQAAAPIRARAWPRRPRELREETGISASPGELGEPVWHEVTEFSFAGIAYRMEQDFFLLRIAAAEVSTDGMESDEREYSIGHYWWSVAELAAATEPFYPVALPELLARIS